MEDTKYNSLTDPNFLSEEVEVKLTGEDLKWLSRILDRQQCSRNFARFDVFEVEGEQLPLQVLWRIDDTIRAAVIALVTKYDRINEEARR